MARGEPISPQQRHERCARIGRNGETVLAHLRIDQTKESILLVRVAGQGDRCLCPLAYRAQRRVAPQISRLDDHAGVGRG